MSSLASAVVLPLKATPTLTSGADSLSLLRAYITNAVDTEDTNSTASNNGTVYFWTFLKSRNQRAPIQHIFNVIDNYFPKSSLTVAGSVTVFVFGSALFLNLKAEETSRVRLA
jgi:hypothetical protein